MKALMICGTGSGVGKSLITGAFCRLLHNKGLRVAPFKAQNMSSNLGQVNGFVMSRAQIVQAQAAGIDPQPEMNPIVLCPIGNARSIVYRMGKEYATLSATEYYQLKDEHFQIVTQAYDRLAADHDLIVLEGAGSPAEINLMHKDIVNMRIAEYAEATVLLVGDISRGGVFAALKGTYDLLPQYHKLIAGFIINKFSGDKALLQPGPEMLAEMTGRPVYGVLPIVEHRIEEEDSLDSKQQQPTITEPEQHKEWDILASVLKANVDTDAILELLK